MSRVETVYFLSVWRITLNIFRSSHRRCSARESVLINSAKIHKKTLQISVKLGSKLGQKLSTSSYFMSSCTNRIEIFNDFFSLICSQPRDKKNRARYVLLFKYFLNNLLLTIFVQMTLSRLVELLQQKMNDSLLEKMRTQFCAAVC